MNHRHASLAFAVCALLATANAQTNVGDVALTGFSSSTFGLFTGSTPVVGCPAAFGNLSQTILWDELDPQSFLVGGFGFIGRATIFGPGSVVYTPLTTNVSAVAQMAFDAQRQVVFADFGTAQLHRLDPVAGTVTAITTGVQPWGQDLGASVVDPLTGDIVCGGNGDIYRLPGGSGPAVPLATNLGGFVSGLQIDPQNGDVLATVLTVSRVIRIAANGTVSDVSPPFAVPGPNALDLDQNGDLVVGGGVGDVFRVPRAGGTPVFLVTNTQPFGNVNGIAVVGGGATSFGRAFGTACNGSFGPTTLAASGPFAVGATLTLTSTNHGAGTIGALVLGLDAQSYLGIPLPFALDGALGTSGCTLYTSADAMFPGVATGSGPAQLAFSFALPPTFAGGRFYAQHVALEPVAGGLSFSNGLAFRIR